MALRLPHRTPLWGALLLVLAGCTSPVGSAASTTSVAAAADDGPVALTRVEEVRTVAAGTHGRVDEIAVDANGRSVFLTIDETGALSVDLPQGNASGASRRVSLDSLDDRTGVATIAVDPDGDVLVTGYEGDRLAVARVSSGGRTEIVPVQADLGLSAASDVTTALAPDGSALYVAFVDIMGTPQLIAVDPSTGAVVNRVVHGSWIPGRITPAAIAVSPSGDRVFVALDVELGSVGSGRTTATLQRLTDGLESLGEVPLVSGQERSRTAQLVAGREGTAYATLVVGDVGTPEAEIRLVAVPAGAPDVTEVAAFPGLDDVRALAVDRSGRWAYVGGLANAPDPLTLTVTPIEVSSGIARPPVQLCDRGELSDIVLLDDRDEGWAAGRCVDTQFAPEVWTLR